MLLAVSSKGLEVYKCWFVASSIAKEKEQDHYFFTACKGIDNIYERNWIQMYKLPTFSPADLRIGLSLSFFFNVKICEKVASKGVTNIPLHFVNSDYCRVTCHIFFNYNSNLLFEYSMSLIKRVLFNTSFQILFC